MPFLACSHNTLITGSNFIDQTVNNNISVINDQTGIDLLLAASNREATHDSSARDYASRCHTGTREQQIEDFVYWTVPSAGADDPLPLFWMKGPAGVGKSAIAQTCAEKLKELGKLGASFFFSLNGRDEATEFIPTIAYQLCIRFPDYHNLIDQRIRHHKAILDKTMEHNSKHSSSNHHRNWRRLGRALGRRSPLSLTGSMNAVVPMLSAKSSRPLQLPLAMAPLLSAGRSSAVPRPILMPLSPARMSSESLAHPCCPSQMMPIQTSSSTSVMALRTSFGVVTSP
ncbi:hypothetical protein P691DRAFT_585559 [Macrolepiota fuliginosa MF-IS2]|uniref:Nephrocystin 3-like N-terminal domain-containing protein n=1 Tax=Macrolepiota fuliginosa MF-IS2 TaxID=1400762 RepID=A0A9P5XF54_9AGAR|nr:hypothetical protein P691DRAFT_585559 [Macrolepiota fuliginosa MF-IS2]